MELDHLASRVSAGADPGSARGSLKAAAPQRLQGPKANRAAAALAPASLLSCQGKQERSGAQIGEHSSSPHTHTHTRYFKGLFLGSSCFMLILMNDDTDSPQAQAAAVLNAPRRR